MNSEIIFKLENYLSNNIHKLNGTFVNINSGYDEMICNILDELIPEPSRYWDAIWK